MADGTTCVVQVTHTASRGFVSRALLMSEDLHGSDGLEHHVLAWDDARDGTVCASLQAALPSPHTTVSCITTPDIINRLPGTIRMPANLSAPMAGRCRTAKGLNPKWFAWNAADAVYLAWFDRTRCRTYWFVEYDVAWNGNAMALFSHFQARPYDYICSAPRPLDLLGLDKGWKHAAKRCGQVPPKAATCQIQVVRASRRLLELAANWSATPHNSLYCEMRLASLCESAEWCTTGNLLAADMFGSFTADTNGLRNPTSFSWDSNPVVPPAGRQRHDRTRFYHRVKD